MEGLDWRLISPRKNKELVALFTLEEITKVVFSCDGNKFPSADGLSMAFFQENLDLIKGDLEGVFKEFLQEVS